MDIWIYTCLPQIEAEALLDVGYSGYLDFYIFCLLLKQKPFLILDIVDIWIYTCLSPIEAEALLDVGYGGYLDFYIFACDLTKALLDLGYNGYLDVYILASN